MLQIKNISKEYKTAGLVQKALDNVSLNLRDNEFVAILGPSGSGKTTLLNIIGGLDRYDSGNLIINGIYTKDYKDRDWDSYRNHTVGFVFQSYNLIPHQNILSNVELALTISGISKAERRVRAKHALEQVGLGDQIHKKPNQLSGGQMQRVAIARALVNDPHILLADEPTGALDSDTSIQVMDLLKEVAKDRLVVMVTHNPELAEAYATRVVKLKDGQIRSDSHPFPINEDKLQKPKHQNMGKTSMSLLTSLALSFNNLKTKKGRTILTAFAGSIGIIGIALIMSLSNGVNNYIKTVEEETLSEYPLQIQSAGYDMSAMMTEPVVEEGQTSEGDIQVVNMLTNMFSTVGANDLTSLKQFLNSKASGIGKYTNGVEYGYNIEPQIYRMNKGEIRQVHPDQSYSALGFGSSTSTNSMMSTMMSTDVFFQLPENENLYMNQYDVKAGHWPENYRQCVLVLTSKGNIGDFLLYTLGLRDAEELDKMIEQFSKEEKVAIPEKKGSYTYEDILGTTFKLVHGTDYYAYDKTYNVWKDKRDNETYMKNLVKNGETLEIVGIVQAKEEASAAMLTSGIYYIPALKEHIIERAADREIVKAQLKDPKKNVFTGKDFNAKESENDKFDLRSLFSVDTEKLQAAFTFDEAKLRVDLSLINPDLENLSLPKLEVKDLLGQLNIQLAEEEIQSLMQQLQIGYQKYLKQHPEADFSKLETQLSQYLKSPEVSAILKKQIEAAIKDNKDIALTQEQMEDIFDEIVKGYGDFAEKNHFLDMSKMTQHFIYYLQSEEAQTILMKAMMNIMDESKLEAQMDAVLETYMKTAMKSVGDTVKKQLRQAMDKTSQSMQDAFRFDADVFSQAIKMNMDQQELFELMMSMMSKEVYSYEENLRQLGYANPEEPSQISIYPKNFESKEKVLDILDGYNNRMEKTGQEDKVITYTDLVGTLMSSVTDIVNMISYVLMAFVAISLVVSSIMIGVITYISVLERKKEIGILRAIGASKGNISQVFNAETFIVGLLAGLIGIGVTLLLLIPTNGIIHSIAGKAQISASLPVSGAIILIILSVALTLIGGIIPSRKAAREDPVTALRTE